MSGPRYSGWTPIVVVGDREVAAQHVPEARKLLGFVLEEAKRNGLGIANLRRELQDGTVLLAEKISELPRVTIIAPGPPPVEEPPEPRGGFIVWPRWDVPTGDPAQRGSQVDPTGNDPTAWLEFAGSRVVTRYWRRWDVVDQIQGARYESYNRPDLYPDGLYFFGNIDWKDGEDLALSFYGFCSRYVHDVALLDIGARWVLQQGQALFDRISYRDELQQDPPEYLSWRINSACVRKTSAGAQELVVAFTNYTQGQPTTAQSAFVAFRLHRNEGTPQKGDWVIEPGSHRLLGMTPGQINPEGSTSGNTFTDSAMPWFFNGDGTRAIRTVNSEQTAAVALVNTMTQEVEISDSSITHTAVQAAYLQGNYAGSGGNFALVAPTRGLVVSDFAGMERKDAYLALRRSEGRFAVEANNYQGMVRVSVVLEFDGGEITLIDRDFAVGNDRQDYHLLAYMDVRHNLFSGWRIQGFNGAHTIQPFAYMAGRMVYGQSEPVAWDPSSGTGAPFPGLDTRAPGAVTDGLVFGSYWVGASGSGWGPRTPNQTGVIWNKHPREGLIAFSGSSLLVPLMMDRQGMRDFLGFDWAGGWNYNKGRYCVSIPGAYTGALNYLTGHDLGALLGVTAEDRRFYPLTVLPKPI